MATETRYTNDPTRNAGARTTHDPTVPQGGATYAGILKRWTGAAWVKAPLKRWTGAAWVDAVLKRWTGSAWVIVDTTGV